MGEWLFLKTVTPLMFQLLRYKRRTSHESDFYQVLFVGGTWAEKNALSSADE